MSVVQKQNDFIEVQEEGYSDNKTLSVGKTSSGQVFFNVGGASIVIVPADDFKAIIEHLGAPQIAEILGLKVSS